MSLGIITRTVVYITVFLFIFSLFLFTFFSIIEGRAVAIQPPQTIAIKLTHTLPESLILSPGLLIFGNSRDLVPLAKSFAALFQV